MCSIVAKRVFIFALTCVACVALFAPAYAHADKSHECVSDVIQAEVLQNGSLHVVDAREYEFEGRYTLTAAQLDPPVGGSVVVNGVSVIDEHGTSMQLAEVPFQSSWRTAGGPASGNYAIDAASNTIYAFSTTEDARKTFVFDYTYTNAVTQYDDVSILYWQFVGQNWDVTTNNARAYLHLPVPVGQSVDPGQNVYAYGHGDINGNVAFESDGTIEFDARSVKPRQFAEMRVAFPASWTPDIAAFQKVTGDGLPQVLAEEQEWQQQTQMRRIADLLMFFIPLLVSLICIVAAIVLFLRHGREHKPTFTGDYWRDVPEKGTNPAVIARLMRWDKADANDLAAVLMHLSNLGVVTLTSEKQIEERRILPDKEHVTYRLTLNPEARENARLDRIDQEALELVFDTIGAGADSVTLDDITQYASDNAQSYVNSMESWQGAVSAEVFRRDFFEAAGENWKHRFLIGACALLLIGMFVSIGVENFVPLIGLLPGIIALVVLAFFMPRRSQEAVDVYARAQALKRWFKDFTALDEAVPTDAKVWGELLVYAYVLGVMDEAVANLNQVAPEIWSDDVFLGSMLWYYNPFFIAHAGAASASFFGDAFANTMSTAQSALSSASGGGGFNFGGGGGFSSFGGGGGFGGMGGGFSR